jgi:hypothetical protein
MELCNLTVSFITKELCHCGFKMSELLIVHKAPLILIDILPGILIYGPSTTTNKLILLIEKRDISIKCSDFSNFCFYQKSFVASG